VVDGLSQTEELLEFDQVLPARLAPTSVIAESPGVSADLARLGMARRATTVPCDSARSTRDGQALRAQRRGPGPREVTPSSQA
jgi:hypothetical protein